MSGPSHGSPVALSLWKANDQSRDAGALGDQARGLEQLVAVGIAVGEDPLREAVRREDDVGVGPAHALGEQLEVGLVVVPALDEDELGAVVEGVLEAVAVPADRECASSAARARAATIRSAPSASARSTASAIRGVQCFMPT